ncbi:MAG: hypothetical protein MJA82_00960 [Clostridia bacterium]|nr:hypothetical protein [Clostridia bacterium]
MFSSYIEVEEFHIIAMAKFVNNVRPKYFKENISSMPVKFCPFHINYFLNCCINSFMKANIEIIESLSDPDCEEDPVSVDYLYFLYISSAKMATFFNCLSTIKRKVGEKSNIYIKYSSPIDDYLSKLWVEAEISDIMVDGFYGDFENISIAYFHVYEFLNFLKTIYDLNNYIDNNVSRLEKELSIL